MRIRRRLDVRSAAVPALLALSLGACGGGGESSDPPPAAEAPAAEASAEPRVFFISPTDGAEVESPVLFEFGAENLEVKPIQDPLVVEPGVVHYHIGYNTDCLPPGEIIPTADPWVHFGDGSNVFETLLDPGEYRLALQAGDGEHRTLEGDGYCEIVNITVVESEAASEDGDAASEG